MSRAKFFWNTFLFSSPFLPCSCWTTWKLVKPPEKCKKSARLSPTVNTCELSTLCEHLWTLVNMHFERTCHTANFFWELPLNFLWELFNCNEFHPTFQHQSSQIKTLSVLLKCQFTYNSVWYGFDIMRFQSVFKIDYDKKGGNPRMEKRYFEQSQNGT